MTNTTVRGESTLNDQPTALRRRALRSLLIAIPVVAAAVVLAFINPSGPLGLAQAASDGLRLGLILALIGMGLSLVFATSGVFNFAHGELATLGALAAWWFNTAGVPLVLSILLAVPIGALAGFASEQIVWRPLRRRRVSLTSALVVAIGIGLAARSSYLFIIGGSSRSYAEYTVQVPIEILGIAVLPKQLVTELVCVVILISLGVFLARSSLGQSIRAVSDDSVLAAVSGIAVDRTLSIVWILGGALAALGGALLGLFEQVSWQMGNQVLLLIIAGVTLGGLGTVRGALIGSVIVGVLTQVSVLFLPAELKYVTALLLLIVILLLRPSGIFGRRSRVG
jgi:neutral amino acid transport system permease protein